VRKKKSKRMQPILRVAEIKEKNAAAALGEAQTHLQMQTARLQELENYYSEYVARFHQSAQLGIAISKVHSFNSFLEKLNQAIEQQKQAVKSAEELLQQRRQLWLANRGQVKVYNNVITRFQDEEHRAEEKKHQKDLDEHAQQMFQRNS
jgi:flagellar FliJ protein